MATVPPDPIRYLPLRPDVFAILLTLLEGDTHGYGIIKRANAGAGRRGQLQPGALYRLLRQMLADDLVEEAPAPTSDPSTDERRRYYRITAFGRAVARAEARRMEGLVGVARHRRLLTAGRTHPDKG
jgi:DNA-binding PadR family transcriptional regulator